MPKLLLFGYIRFLYFITLVSTGIVAEVHIMIIIIYNCKKKAARKMYCMQKKFKKINNNFHIIWEFGKTR